MRRVIQYAAAALIVAAGSALAENRGQLPLWQVNGEHNRITLLASVHLLRPDDYPLPEAIYAAYETADSIVMELDLDDLDPAEAAVLAAELGIIQDDATLATLLGEETYARAAAIAATAALPLDSLAKAEPWLAAITLEQLMLMRAGFEPSLGIERHLMQRAVDDGKRIEGLETLRQQLEMLDRLPPSVQEALLIRTLEASADIDAVIDTMIDAWRGGDTKTLEATVLQDMLEHPVLYAKLVVERNRDWVAQLEDLLRDKEDYLVIVGALHLVGADSVPSMLKARGHDVSQW